MGVVYEAEDTRLSADALRSSCFRPRLAPVTLRSSASCAKRVKQLQKYIDFGPRLRVTAFHAVARIMLARALTRRPDDRGSTRLRRCVPHLAGR